MWFSYVVDESMDGELYILKRITLATPSNVLNLDIR